MVGHRDSPWTHFGWASARLDDLLNWVPARITAMLIALCGGSWRALRIAWRDGGKTQSPNAGVVEAAFAGALGVQLGGTNSYDGAAKEGPRLGDPGADLDARSLDAGLRLALWVNLAAILAGTLALWGIHG
jgi:adenosylcobinamide-phosphate synthase